eukprot:428539_1
MGFSITDLILFWNLLIQTFIICIITHDMIATWLSACTEYKYLTVYFIIVSISSHICFVMVCFRKRHVIKSILLNIFQCFKIKIKGWLWRDNDYKETINKPYDLDRCIICQETFNDNNNINLTKCGYHTNCINKCTISK